MKEKLVPPSISPKLKLFQFQTQLSNTGETLKTETHQTGWAHMGFSECVDTILILDRPELLIWRNIVDGLCHFALLLTGSHSIYIKPTVSWIISCIIQILMKWAAMNSPNSVALMNQLLLTTASTWFDAWCLLSKTYQLMYQLNKNCILNTLKLMNNFL